MAVTSSGFIPKTIAELVDDLNAAWRFVFGDAINVSPQSRDGMEIGILSESLSEIWESGEAISQLFNPNGAVDQGLDNICAITGTVRRAASKSTVTLVLTGTPATVVGVGKVASVPSTLARFTTTASGTIVAISAWLGSTGYSLGQRVRNGGTQRIYQCIFAGSSAGAGGPTSTSADITDGTVHWRYLGDGTGGVDVAAEATVTGPIQGYSGTITTIDTAVGGWLGVNNVLDAVPGANIETNAALRTRRVLELGGQGGRSALPELRAAILRVDGVTYCTIFENTSDATVDGVTPHAFEALVEGGADADILEAVANNRPTGIAPIGSTTGSVVDAAGISRTSKFSRPTALVLYVKVFVTKNPLTYPSDGDTQIKDLIVELGNQQPVGRDAEGTEISGWLFPRVDIEGLGVTGVLKMTSPLLVDIVDPPLVSEVIATARERASYDTSRIVVVAIDGTP